MNIHVLVAEVRKIRKDLGESSKTGFPGLKFCAEKWPAALDDTPGQTVHPNGFG